MLPNKKNPRSLLSSYAEPLPISRDKCQELLVLKRFCSSDAGEFFDNLPKELDND